jgi:hypothetical protein
MRSMTLQGTLQGWRVNSRAVMDTTVETGEPKCVSYGELERSTGLSKPAIKMRISNCGDRFLIFDDQGRLSRLKSDLSNCDL